MPRSGAGSAQRKLKHLQRVLVAGFGMARCLWGEDARILVRLMAGYRYTAAAQSGERGSNIIEILVGLDR